MSGLFDDIIDIGSSIFSGDGIGSTLAKTALAGYALSQVTNSVTAQDSKTVTDTTNAAAVDKGVRQQIDASTDNKVPVVYGSAFLGGKVFDAWMSPDNTTMWFAIAICEQTGWRRTNTSPSVIGFEAVYWNNSRVVFGASNRVVAFYDDATGNTTNDPADLVEIYLFNGNGLPSGAALSSRTYPAGSAHTIMPSWGSQYTADNLCFALVKVIYSKDKNITGLGDLKFHVVNTMDDPGDCLFDYLTNTLYGAGVLSGNINE